MRDHQLSVSEPNNGGCRCLPCVRVVWSAFRVWEESSLLVHPLLAVDPVNEESPVSWQMRDDLNHERVAKFFRLGLPEDWTFTELDVKR